MLGLNKLIIMNYELVSGCEKADAGEREVN